MTFERQGIGSALICSARFIPSSADYRVRMVLFSVIVNP